jgi:hypothetical protein
MRGGLVPKDLFRGLDRRSGVCTVVAMNNSTQQDEQPIITSVWSTYGHRFMSTDSENHESCLTCGAMYELSPDEPGSTSGHYHAANGDQPMQCSGDTSMAHGYPGERVDGNADHDCNCLFCA